METFKSTFLLNLFYDSLLLLFISGILPPPECRITHKINLKTQSYLISELRHSYLII